MAKVNIFGAREYSMRIWLDPAKLNNYGLTPVDIGNATTVRLAPEGLAAWSDQQQVLQGREAWETAQDWIDRVNPRFSFEVAERYLMARSYTDADVAAARARREAIRQHLDTVLPAGAVLCLPTTPAPAPLRGERISARRDLRARISLLTCIAGTTGRPQVNLPLAAVGRWVTRGPVITWGARRR